MIRHDVSRKGTKQEKSLSCSQLFHHESMMRIMMMKGSIKLFFLSMMDEEASQALFLSKTAFFLPTFSMAGQFGGKFENSHRPAKSA